MTTKEHQIRVRQTVPIVSEAMRRVTAADQRLLQSTRQENLEFALNEWYGAIIALAAASCIVTESTPGDLIPDASEFSRLVAEVQKAMEAHHMADASRLCWPVT